LNVHASEVHEKKHPSKCIICDASFSRKWSLGVHVLKHENNKPLTKGRPRITKRGKDQQNTFNEDLENEQEKSNKNTLGDKLGDSLQENNLENGQGKPENTAENIMNCHDSNADQEYQGENAHHETFENSSVTSIDTAGEMKAKKNYFTKKVHSAMANSQQTVL
jgi:hypothetical protein